MVRRQATRWMVCLLMAVGLTLVFSANTPAKPPINADDRGVAIRGYDPVAYFTEGKAVEGKEAFSFQWKGARWLFSNAGHRDLFAKDPEQYAPQYGGY